jgi:D-glycero-alpha-D-manno-heptose-7-phosphate kinase
MIITQTPLRISFFGGGTDFPNFYLENGGGVLTSAIDRYIFVIVKERFDDKIRVAYTKTELVDDIDQIQHDLVRECLRKTGIRSRVEIATMGDIPDSGSGLGSSSTVTVGLLNAMYQYLGEPRGPETLAEEASEIELKVLGKPIGIQDQYIGAFGGQRFISFGCDGRVAVDSLELHGRDWQTLNDRLMLFFTNVTRQAESILDEQKRNIEEKRDVLIEMKRLAYKARDCLRSGATDEFGALLHESWQLKKQLASKISNNAIDEIYDVARKAGALGGKIAGAGGGGFMLLYCPPSRKQRVRSALSGLTELPFSFERAGTKVIFDYSRVTTRRLTERGMLHQKVPAQVWQGAAQANGKELIEVP